MNRSNALRLCERYIRPTVLHRGHRRSVGLVRCRKIVMTARQRSRRRKISPTGREDPALRRVLPTEAHRQQCLQTLEAGLQQRWLPRLP
ncbi:MAG: hypothetical protein ABDH31_02945 [Chlorobiota bacterium]